MLVMGRMGVEGKARRLWELLIVPASYFHKSKTTPKN
jgi:hypothetical protein